MTELQINKDAILWKDVQGRVIVLLIENGSFCELNALGSRIWSFLVEGSSKEEIIKALQQSYDIPRETLEKDVDAFIARMTEQGILKA